MFMYEILVPTMMTGKPVRTKHHKKWDEYVRKISGGLTILKPAKGQWLDNTDLLHEERVIPVKIACTDKQLRQILKFTIKHYKQLAVMAYKISEEVIILHKQDVA